MSSLSEQNPMNPQDPLHYAPRWLRERPEAARLSLVGDNAKAAEAAERPASGQQQGPLDARLETAVFESLRQSLNPQVMREPPDLERERDRRSVVFKIAGRFAAATGVAAVVALFFVNIVPVWRQPDASSSFVAAVQSMKTLPPVAADVQDAKADQTSSLPERAEAPAPALSQFKSLLASDAQAPAAEAETPEKPMLQQFMQWNQKTGQMERVR
ncbi:hypothetical protein S58_10350 [Bradyrhizobium oligotrophicum S58]|uniref:Transmembrane protein n=1 Tax=Bradyrhizobium oligotrophicum S58 TaxID=1245469 RepID=M4Z2S0_9BRAD|nr:hypothetical protein [Bradyrhizobium oligotrophicum]BAM87046.1 hypothetical protein S58_10350 [Bradyrhizobium oligotrophicum S58]